MLKLDHHNADIAPLDRSVCYVAICFAAARAGRRYLFRAVIGTAGHGLTRNGHWWMLLVLLAMPFWQALLTVQWSPFLLAVAFYPVLVPLTLCKPTIGFPVAVTRLTWRRIFATGAFLIISLLIMPDWPLRWLGYPADPGPYVPPLLTLPFGPLLLLRYTAGETAVPGFWS